MLSSASMVLVTVPLSPVVTTVPVVSGKVIVRSAVGSVIAIVSSLSSVVAPSKTSEPALAISRVPVIVPPAFGSFSVASSVIAVWTFVEATVPWGV